MLFGKKKDELFNQSDLPTENDVYMCVCVCMYVLYIIYIFLFVIFYVDNKQNFSYINISLYVLNIYII